MSELQADREYLEAELCYAPLHNRLSLESQPNNQILIRMETSKERKIILHGQQLGRARGCPLVGRLARSN